MWIAELTIMYIFRLEKKTKMLYSKISAGVLTDPVIVRVKSIIALQREKRNGADQIRSKLGQA